MGKPIIGLVGGIGSGKSLVAGMLADCGCGVIDADSLAHQCLDTPDCIKKIQEWWGDSVIASHGVPRSKKIAEIVFADPVELKRLEDLLYPLIGARQQIMIADFDADNSITGIVLDAPKLYEAGADRLCDAVIFVKADREVRVSRVVEIRGWTDFQLDQRENMQDSLAMKEEKADHVIENNSGTDILRSQLNRVFSSIVSKIALAKLIPWLDMHQQHSQQREWFQSLVQKSDSSVGMYHRQIVELLKRDFGCSDEMCRFRIELNKKEYVLCYYPVNDGRVDLFPLDEGCMIIME